MQVADCPAPPGRSRVGPIRASRNALSALLIALVSFAPAAHGAALPLAEEDAGAETTERAAAETATSRIEGSVRVAGGEPAAGIRVLLVPIGADAARHMAETDGRGRYEFSDVEHGYYQLVFVDGEEAFLANRVLLLPPEKKVKADFELGKITPADEREGISSTTEVPGLARQASGIARLDEKTGPTGWAWFKTGRGVAVLLGAGTLFVGGLIALADDDPTEAVQSEPAP